MEACQRKFDGVRNGVITNEPRLLGRELPANMSVLPITTLYNALISDEVEYYATSELLRILSSKNTFYIMELENNRYRAGSARDTFRGRLNGHETYMAARWFKKFWGVYLFRGPSTVDCVTLENDFFIEASKILKLPKLSVERCGARGFGAKPEQIRRALELCFTSPRLRYNGLVEIVTNDKVLGLLSTDKWKNILQNANMRERLYGQRQVKF